MRLEDYLMSKALKGIGTAIVFAGLVVATGGVALAMSAGVGVAGAASLAGGTILSVGSFSVTASGLLAAGSLASSIGVAMDRPKATTSGISTEWLADTDQGLPFAFGRIGVAGFIINKDEYGNHDQNFSVVTVYSAASPIKSFAGFKADGKTVTFDGSGEAVSPSEWANDRMFFTTRLGAQPDTALASPSGLTGSLPEWGSAYKLSGKACSMLTFVQDSKLTAYPDGEPGPVVTIEGLYAWDPRLDSTYPGGSGSCRLNNPATWVWQRNGAIFGLKWALGLWEDPTGKGAPQVGTCVGGIGSTLDGIDVASFVYAANVADANEWICSAWPNSKEDKHAVLTNLLQSAGAVPSRVGGRISCISRGAPQSSIVTVTAKDTAGPIEIDTAMPRLDRINTITPRYWSEEHEWEMVPAEPVSVPDYVTQDGGKRPRGVDYGYVPGATQAAQLAAYDIVDSREGISGTIPFKPHMRRIKPGDCFTISEPGFVLDGQKVKCWGRSFDPQSLTVRIRFRSETDAKHAFALGKTGVPPPPPSLSVTDPTVVPAPDGGDWSLAGDTFTLNGLSIPAIVFSGDVTNAMASAVIFEFRPVDTPERPWAGAGIEGARIERKEVAGLTPGTDYEGSVQYQVGGVIGDRLVLGPVTSGVFDSGGTGFGASVFPTETGGARLGLGTVSSPAVAVTVVGGATGATIQWFQIEGDPTISGGGTSFNPTWTTTMTSLGQVKTGTFMGVVTRDGQSANVFVAVDFTETS